MLLTLYLRMQLRQKYHRESLGGGKVVYFGFKVLDHFGLRHLNQSYVYCVQTKMVFFSLGL